MSVEESMLGVVGIVVGIKGVEHGLEDGDTDRVGASGRVIFVSEGFEERREYGIELSCARVESRIRCTQVGDPLADGREGVTHCRRSDRVIGLSAFSVLDAVDEEAAELGLVAHAITEGDGVAEGVAVGLPVPEDLGVGTLRLRGGGSCGESERSAEMSGKEISGGTWRRRHPLGCG